MGFRAIEAGGDFAYPTVFSHLIFNNEIHKEKINERSKKRHFCIGEHRGSHRSGNLARVGNAGRKTAIPHSRITGGTLQAVPPTATIIDLSCGSGALLNGIDDWGSTRYGLDIDNRFTGDGWRHINPSFPKFKELLDDLYPDLR